MSIGFEEVVVFEGRKGQGKLDPAPSANLTVGTLRVPLDLHEEIQKYLMGLPSNRRGNKPKYIRLMAAGLKVVLS